MRELSEEEKKTKSTGEMVTDNALKLQKAVLRQKIMIGALVGVIAVGGAGAAGYKLGWFGGDNDKAQEEQVSADIDPNAGDWDGTIPEAPKGDPNAENIELPGYPKIYIPAGQTDVDVAFSNPEGNPCYFTFQLVLKDSGEVLYESKQVPPGEAITTATLSKALDAGEYAAELRITTASIVDLSPMNGANMETVLDVR
ncbi:hypothetical protein [Blautia marasmi]|uniref:hypothetical protein n=1 Tax=Blautia marasmi TaxID=1917868 RepID=UPI00210BF8FB|nr:hypothetical protein [Blautia marasmi]